MLRFAAGLIGPSVAKQDAVAGALLRLERFEIPTSNRSNGALGGIGVDGVIRLVVGEMRARPLSV